MRPTEGRQLLSAGVGSRRIRCGGIELRSAPSQRTKVGGEMGSYYRDLVLGQAASPRFPTPLIEPNVRFSRIRLSDWLHLKARRPM